MRLALTGRPCEIGPDLTDDPLGIGPALPFRVSDGGDVSAHFDIGRTLPIHITVAPTLSTTKAISIALSVITARPSPGATRVSLIAHLRMPTRRCAATRRISPSIRAAAKSGA